MACIRLGLTGLLITLLLLASECVAAVEKEYAMKAGFLFNFARYGEWSGVDTTPKAFTICSPDPSFVAIATKVLEGQKVDGLPINHALVSFSEELNQCQLLFVTSEFVPTWSKLANHELFNVMVVGEGEGFIEAGGQIRFFLSGGKIRFEVSPKKLKRSGITMSSRVLRLGRVLER